MWWPTGSMRERTSILTDTLDEQVGCSTNVGASAWSSDAMPRRGRQKISQKLVLVVDVGPCPSRTQCWRALSTACRGTFSLRTIWTASMMAAIWRQLLIWHRAHTHGGSLRLCPLPAETPTLLSLGLVACPLLDSATAHCGVNRDRYWKNQPAPQFQRHRIEDCGVFL